LTGICCFPLDNNTPAPTLSNKTNNNSHGKFSFISSNFPPIPTPHAQTPASNPMMVKLDDLLEKMSEVKIQLTNLASKHDKFEQFIKEKNESDLLVKENLNLLSKQSRELNGDVGQMQLLIKRHENMFIKLLIPMFEDLFTVIASQNLDKKGNILDADLKFKLERYLVQMKKASENKPFTN